MLTIQVPHFLILLLSSWSKFHSKWLITTTAHSLGSRIEVSGSSFSRRENEWEQSAWNRMPAKSLSQPPWPRGRRVRVSRGTEMEVCSRLLSIDVKSTSGTSKPTNSHFSNLNQERQLSLLDRDTWNIATLSWSPGLSSQTNWSSATHPICSLASCSFVIAMLIQYLNYLSIEVREFSIELLT